ncbi:MAG: hypothetical protein MZV65_52900 [Chromatiales bacterium]|nr:hypothetical protein [Chromatiales bacterium]
MHEAACRWCSCPSSGSLIAQVLRLGGRPRCGRSSRWPTPASPTTGSRPSCRRWKSQVREHQIQLRRRLESIKRIHKATDTLEDRMKELDHVRDGIREQEKALEGYVEAITRILEFKSAQDAGFVGIEQSA